MFTNSTYLVQLCVYIQYRVSLLLYTQNIALENSSSVCFHTVYSSVCTYITKFCCVLLIEQTMQLNCGLSRFTIKRKTFWRSALLLSAQGWRRIFQLQKWAGLWLTVLTHRFCLTQHRWLFIPSVRLSQLSSTFGEEILKKSLTDLSLTCQRIQEVGII